MELGLIHEFVGEQSDGQTTLITKCGNPPPEWPSELAIDIMSALHELVVTVPFFIKSPRLLSLVSLFNLSC